MLRTFRSLALLSLLTLPSFAEEFNSPHAGINFGVGISRPALSGFYSWGRNQINVGTNFTLYTFEEGVIIAQPSITYNRYLTNNGFYSSVGIITTYMANQNHDVWEQRSPPDTGWHYRAVDESDWEKPWVVAGIGKNFQWEKWGLHIDGNLVSPIGEDFIETWAYWIGIGGSYRFKLD